MMNIIKCTVLWVIVLVGCSPRPVVVKPSPTPEADSTPEPTRTHAWTPAPTPISAQEVIATPEAIIADVLSVNVTGDAKNYQFNVEIYSPDTGCHQYADWWEVLNENGSLIYRRVLLHSHVNEQPFLRSGGPVEIFPDTVVIVRAHMNKDGYGGRVLGGSVSGGFQPVELEADFAVGVEALEPLPEDCAF